MENKKIYKVFCTLQPKKFETIVQELDAHETASLYKIKEESLWGKKYLKKEDLLKVTSGMLREHIYNTVFYTTYCLQEDIDKAKNLVEIKVLQEFNRMYTAMTQMNNLVKEKQNAL